MQTMFGVVKSRIFGILFQTLSQQSTDSSRLKRGFGQTLVEERSVPSVRAVPGAVCAAFSCSNTNPCHFLGAAGLRLCVCREVSLCSGIRGSCLGVRMCLPELIRLVFYTLPYLPSKGAAQTPRLLSKASPCWAFSRLLSGMVFFFFPLFKSCFKGGIALFSDVSCLTKFG